MTRTPRRNRVSNYPFNAVCQHIRKHHPGCPDFAVEHFATEIAKRDWKGATLGNAVGIVMHNSLRHMMTEYEALLLQGVERLEARRRVQPKVNAMLAMWRRPPRADR